MEVLLALVAVVGIICASFVGIARSHDAVKMAEKGYCQVVVERPGFPPETIWRPCKETK
jgi:hypothetical protein